jgi:hypothetical protein
VAAALVATAASSKAGQGDMAWAVFELDLLLLTAQFQLGVVVQSVRHVCTGAAATVYLCAVVALCKGTWTVLHFCPPYTAYVSD